MGWTGMSEDVSREMATLGPTRGCHTSRVCSENTRLRPDSLELTRNQKLLLPESDGSEFAQSVFTSRKRKRRKRRRWLRFISSSIQLFLDQAIIQPLAISRAISSLAIFWWLIACSLCLLPSSGRTNSNLMILIFHYFTLHCKCDW